VKLQETAEGGLGIQVKKIDAPLSPLEHQAQQKSQRGLPLVRSNEILAALAKGWSLRAIWSALNESKEVTCGYKTFIGRVRRLQREATAEKAITPKKKKISRGIQHLIRRTQFNEYCALDFAG